MLIGPRSATILGVQAAQTTTTGELLPKESHACASRPTHAYRRARPPGDVKNRWYPAANRDAKVEWDFEDRLVKVTKNDGTVVENVYDVDGVLVRTAVNGVGTDYLVDTSGGLSHVVAEVDGSGTVTALYVRAGDMLLEEVRGGVVKMYEADGLGSVRGLLDVSGARTDTYAYEAFGSTLSSTGSDANPYRFAGERWSDGVGLYQNRARWLDTRTGRFVSVDPLEGSDDAPMTMNPYIYGSGSPATYVDSTGEEFTLVGTMISISIYSQLSAVAQPAIGTKQVKGKRIVVDITSQILRAYSGSKLTYDFEAITGAEGHRTTPGNYSILRKQQVAYSRKYGAQMNWAMFFDTDGKAIHQYHGWFWGARTGKEWISDWFGSHGCVRLKEEDAQELFGWTPKGTPVQVVK